MDVLLKKVAYFFALVFLFFLALSITNPKISYSKIHEKNEITLEWQRISKAKGYDFELWKGEKIVIQKRTLKNAINFEVEPGKYRFRIRSLASKRLMGPWSEFKFFIVKPIPPILDIPKFDKNTEEDEQNAIMLHWIEPKHVDNYQLRIWKDDKVLVDKKIKRKNDFRIGISSAGKYHFALATIYHDLSGPFSQKKELIISTNEITSESEKAFQKGKSFRGTFTISPSLGVTSLSYSETLEKDYSALLLTGKVSAGYRFSEKWDTAANTYFTILPVTASDKSSVIRFLGINFRLGYQIALSKTAYLDIMPGWYLTTTFTTSNAFGFKNMNGPQIFPVLKYKLGTNIGAYNYFKYSPVMYGFGMPTFKSKEIATGFGIIIPSSKIGGWPLSIAIDYAKLDINFFDLIYIQSNSISLSLGVSF